MSDKFNCENCYWNDKCLEEDKLNEKCEHYTPIDDLDEVWIDEIIELEKEIFKNEFYQYQIQNGNIE